MCLSITVHCTLCKIEITKIVVSYGLSWEAFLSRRGKRTYMNLNPSLNQAFFHLGKVVMT